tara:strand:- start:6493 stop:7674 length:1182 start_codon:yes stop_codon:yes gene_type:complete
MLSLIHRNHYLFDDDISINNKFLKNEIQNSSFLVLGGAGTIGQAVTKQIFKRSPKKLHVVDISENNLVELVRDIRSSYGYIKGDFKTFALDIGSDEYDAFFNDDGEYDYVLNLSALKHVRSEKDPYTIMRMINVNIFNTEKTLVQSIKKGVKKYFCVSTDKAANPANIMGASKLIMEMVVSKLSSKIDVSLARFANVAFSDGSLLHGFNQRINKLQPIVAPTDIKRYFIVPKESGELCLISCIFGNNRDIFFPKLNNELDLISFESIAKKYLEQKNLTPYLCNSENEAREMISKLDLSKHWPCYFSISDTTGEKGFEEFYTSEETLDMNKFKNIGIIKNSIKNNNDKVEYFREQIISIKKSNDYNRSKLIKIFEKTIPNLNHIEKNKFLDSKM